MYYLLRKGYALFALALLAAGSGLLAGCGGNGSSGNGTLSVSLADAPDPSATAVHVTIDRVEVNVNGGWEPVTEAPQTYNLMELTQTDVTLGAIVLPPGRYTQVRLFPSEVTVTDDYGTHPAKVPSGDQTGIKINVDCEVYPGQVTGLLLDFNVAKSIVQTGNGEYHLKPVIPAAVKALSGTITGTVVNPGSQPIRGAVVEAIGPSGSEVNSSVTIADGTFKIWALAPDTYALKVTSGKKTMVLEGVEVRAGENTEVGSLKLQ